MTISKQGRYRLPDYSPAYGVPLWLPDSLPLIRNPRSKMSKLSQLGFDYTEQTAWVSKTIWLAGAYMDGYAVCDDLREMYEEIDDPKELKRLFGVQLRGADLEMAKAGDFPELDDVMEQVIRKQRVGFLICVNAGVRSYLSGGGYTSSAGHSRFCWFYGATMEGAVKKGQR